MATYSQASRPLRLTTPLGTNVLLVRSLAGTEALSELFSFRLELLADKYVKIPFERLLGQSVTIEIAHPTGVTRTINGIVNCFSQGERDEVFATYEAEVVPRLWLLTRRKNSRIFQQVSVPEILAQVLSGFKYTSELKGTYEPRDYCVQYAESDFAFISRLMEEEGISYFFRHQDQSHELVLTDATTNLPAIEGPANVVYETVRGAVKDNMRITAWKKSQQICSNRYTLWDHCFELPAKHLEAADTVPATLQVGKVTHKLPGTEEKLEAYAYPGEYAKRFDGIDPGGGDRAADLANIFNANKRTASVRMQAGAVQALTIAGTSNCVNFTPGGKFTLERHFDADGNYRITRIEHSAKLPNVYRSGNDGETVEYENRFTCIPADVPFRPQRVTPRPQIAGMQTATVVGPEGEEIFCDKYGRIKAQFHWDRLGKNDSGSSCWIRVGQIWAGKRWGASFLPRVGHEVIVIFEDGDPDQPIVIGSVYNADNMPPFVLPDQKMVAGIKSCSVKGEPSRNYNGFLFHDENGVEHFQLHSERHEIRNTEVARREYVGQTHVRVVGNIFGTGSGSGGGSGGGGSSGGMVLGASRLPAQLSVTPTLVSARSHATTLPAMLFGNASAQISLSGSPARSRQPIAVRPSVGDPYELLSWLNAQRTLPPDAWREQVLALLAKIRPDRWSWMSTLNHAQLVRFVQHVLTRALGRVHSSLLDSDVDSQAQRVLGISSTAWTASHRPPEFRKRRLEIAW